METQEGSVCEPACSSKFPHMSLAPDLTDAVAIVSSYSKSLPSFISSLLGKSGDHICVRKVINVKQCGSVCGPDGFPENGVQDAGCGSSRPPAWEAHSSFLLAS